MNNSIRNLILAEIAWCETHRGESNKGDIWEDGFISGLYQALSLLGKSRKIDTMSERKIEEYNLRPERAPNTRF